MASVQFGQAQFQKTTVAIAATTDIVTDVPTMIVRLEGGSGPISSFGAGIYKWRKVYCADAVTIVHSDAGTAGSIFLPTQADINCDPGDWFEAFSDALGSWTVAFYQRRDGTALA